MISQWYMVVCRVEGGTTYRFFSEISGPTGVTAKTVLEWDAAAAKETGKLTAVTAFYRLSEGPSDD